jgi:hypothetical protein
MHSEDVTSVSTMMVTIAGPAAWAPSKATSSGTPMKPVLGKAATSAPKDASFQPIRPLGAVCVTAIVNTTITTAHSRYTATRLPSSSCAMGVLAPKRYSMEGNAKYSTKPLSPGMASSGSMRRRAAT